MSHAKSLQCRQQSDGTMWPTYWTGVSNWQKLKKITDDHVIYFYKNPAKSVMTTLKRRSVFKNVEDALKCIKPISIALDKVKADGASIADAVEEWKTLQGKFRDMGTERQEWLQFVEFRYSQSVPKLWFLVNVLHPKYVGKSLSQSELRDAKEVMMNEYPDHIAAYY